MTIPNGAAFDLDPTLSTQPVGTIVDVGAVLGAKAFTGWPERANYCTNSIPALTSGWGTVGANYHNKATRPRPQALSTSTVGWVGEPGSAGAGSLAVRAATADRPVAYRYTWSSPSTSPAGYGGIATDATNIVSIESGYVPLEIDVTIECSIAQRLVINLKYIDVSGNLVSSDLGPQFTTVPNVPETHMMGTNLYPPAGTVRCEAQVMRYGTGAVAWQPGDWLEVQALQAEQNGGSSFAGFMFDGDTQGGTWSGTAGESSSSMNAPATLNPVLDATVSRRAGQTSKKYAHNPIYTYIPSHTVCWVEKVGSRGVAYYTAQAALPLLETSIYIYTTSVGLSASWIGLNGDRALSAAVPIVPNVWTRVAQSGVSAPTQILPSLLVTSATITTGAEVVWMCDARVGAPGDYFDSTFPGATSGTGAYLGASFGPPDITWEETDGHPEVSIKMGDHLLSDDEITQPAGATIAYVATALGAETGTEVLGIHYPVGGFDAILGVPSESLHYPAITMDEAENSENKATAGVPFIFIGTVSPVAQNSWVDGLLGQQSTYSTIPAGVVNKIKIDFPGRIRRLIVWDRVLSDDEVNQATLGLYMAHIMNARTVTWDAPVNSSGSPITGFVVRVYDTFMDSVTESEILPAVMTQQIDAGAGFVQVIAVNKFGRSLPVETAL